MAQFLDLNHPSISDEAHNFISRIVNKLGKTTKQQSADVDINQMSGTCPTGVTTCNGIITLDIDSENAVIQINQKDATNDS